ncbi:hypothetical protein, partial [Lawsonia intracellularis]
LLFHRQEQEMKALEASFYGDEVDAPTGARSIEEFLVDRMLKPQLSEDSEEELKPLEDPSTFYNPSKYGEGSFIFFTQLSSEQTRDQYGSDDENGFRYHTVIVQGEGEPKGDEAPPPFPFYSFVSGDSGEMQSGDTGGAGPPSEELSLGNTSSSSDDDIITSSIESSSSSSSSGDEADVSSFETSLDEGSDCVDGVYGAVGGEEPEKKKGKAVDDVDGGRKKEEDSYTDKEKKKKKKSKKERKLESELEKL